MTLDELISVGRALYFAHGIDAATRVVAAAAWDEGANAAWDESGEGWNGEYPHDSAPQTPNPYRIEHT